MNLQLYNNNIYNILYVYRIIQYKYTKNTNKKVSIFVDNSHPRLVLLCLGNGEQDGKQSKKWNTFRSSSSFRRLRSSGLGLDVSRCGRGAPQPIAAHRRRPPHPPHHWGAVKRRGKKKEELFGRKEMRPNCENKLDAGYPESPK